MPALSREEARRILGGPDAAFWGQFLESTEAFAGYHWAGPNSDLNNARDAQMARNLLWLAAARPDVKIVVWAANFHVLREARAIEPIHGPIRRLARRVMWPELESWVFDDLGGIVLWLFHKPPDERLPIETVTMGEHLWKALGTRMYTVGFTALEGRQGLPGGRAARLPPQLQGGLEDEFARRGLEQAFLDLRRSDPELRRSRPGRLFWGYAAAKADWSRVYDGVFLQRRMTPSTIPRSRAASGATNP